MDVRLHREGDDDHGGHGREGRGVGLLGAQVDLVVLDVVEPAQPQQEGGQEQRVDQVEADADQELVQAVQAAGERDAPEDEDGGRRPPQVDQQVRRGPVAVVAEAVAQLVEVARGQAGLHELRPEDGDEDDHPALHYVDSDVQAEAAHDGAQLARLALGAALAREIRGREVGQDAPGHDQDQREPQGEGDHAAQAVGGLVRRRVDGHEGAKRLPRVESRGQGPQNGLDRLHRVLLRRRALRAPDRC